MTKKKQPQKQARQLLRRFCGRTIIDYPGWTRLQKIAERQEIATFAAAVVVAPPLLGRVIGLNGDRPVACLLRPATVQEACDPGLGTDAIQYRQIDAIEGRNLLYGHLRH